MILRVPRRYDRKCSPSVEEAIHIRYRISKIPLSRYLKFDALPRLLHCTRRHLYDVINRSKRITALQFDDIILVHPTGFKKEVVASAKYAVLKEILKSTPRTKRVDIAAVDLTHDKSCISGPL